MTLAGLHLLPCGLVTAKLCSLACGTVHMQTATLPRLRKASSLR